MTQAWGICTILVVLGVMNINPDPGCDRAKDKDMIPVGLGCHYALNGSTDHSDMHEPGSSMALGHQHGLRSQKNSP